MKKIISLLVFSSLFFSCNKSTVYQSFNSNFANNQWQKTDAQVYNFSIDDTTKNYDITFHFSHVYGYQFKNIPLAITMIYPDGETENLSSTLELFDKNNKPLSDCSGDLCDIYHTIFANKKLSKGNYKITVANTFSHTYLPNVIGVGLEVKAVK